MNIYNVLDLALKNGGEYVLGSSELHTHACYFIYGILKPDEKGRLIKPGRGHEEIICIIQGEVFLRGDKETLTVKKGQAFHIKGEESYFMDNNGQEEAVYVVAGGHSERHSH